MPDRSRPTSRPALLLVCGLAFLIGVSGQASAQTSPPTVLSIALEQEGRVVSDPLIASLVESQPGQPLAMLDVRETIRHLVSLNRFDDVQAYADTVPGGVRLRFVLFPRHPVDRIEFRGSLGLDQADLRRAVIDRFTSSPSAARMAEIAQALRAIYESRGYPAARLTPHIEETHAPDRATMVFEVESGPRAQIRQVQFEQAARDEATQGLGVPAVREGEPYDAQAIERELQRYEAALRAKGFYEARATHSVEYEPAGGATVIVAIDRGPLVTVAFEGDPLPADQRERLVPVSAEGSADQDLLEDATRAITDYLYTRGYRDARVDFGRDERNQALVITFDIRRGPPHVVQRITLDGNRALQDAELVPLLGFSPGEPFVQSSLDTGVASIGNLYRQRGFTRARASADVSVSAGAADPNAERDVEVTVRVVEGPRTLLGDVTFAGNTVFSTPELRELLTLPPGRPFSELEIAVARDLIDLEYRNRGYESVVVEASAALAEDDTRADVAFSISEGPQVIVDHVIITGNERISTATIERELLLRPGEPLGYSARLESQQRLAALGLFRRVRIEELRHGSDPRRDLLVQVEEAPPTTLGYGGGVEAATRLRTGDDGRAEERFEVAPRGFFEIGRRNMFGKNRSVNLFTRVSLRARDILVTGTAPAGGQTVADSNYGFNEYRIVGQFREPRVVGSAADLLVTGIVDQAIRSSFNFIRRQARSELGIRLSRTYSFAGIYSFERTELLDERFTETEKPLIDRIFPQVRLSKFSGSLLRDTRSDVVDTQGGSLLVFTADLAARAIGSEVGFLKTFAQAFKYVRLPTQRRVVLALGARVGAAQGFARDVEGVGTVQDLPASERFFAGGDTTVRGFSLDRLGTSQTISPSGFPTGGNSVVLLNSELRVGVLNAVDLVSFVDAGNVYLRLSDLDVTALRPAAGFGVHYRSPVGPIRVELGFNLDRRELVPGRLERGNVLHISLGRAF